MPWLLACCHKAPTRLPSIHRLDNARSRSLINTNALGPQVRLRKLNLFHQLLVRLGRVVEGEHAPAEAEEDPGAEGDEGPEGELFCFSLQSAFTVRRK